MKNAQNNQQIPKRIRQTEVVKLQVAGQGGVSAAGQGKRPADFIQFACPVKATGVELRVIVWPDETQIVIFNTITWQVVQRFTQTNIGINPDPGCQYWVSLDTSNRSISTGIGEIRKETETLSYRFKADSGEDEKIIHDMFHSIETIEVFFDEEAFEASAFRFPVTIQLPLAIIPANKLTMMDIADVSDPDQLTGPNSEKTKVTIINNLPAACQQLYANVAGQSFQLNTQDFPDFAEAINHNIITEGCWCHDKLIEKAKADEFGGGEKETYLRITLGENYGNSPGIPFVMEIWPIGHQSPIHNHGDANAIIRVLSGAITVNLYSMLSSVKTNQTPFKTATFTQEDVTWISPGMNQIHQLTNEQKDQACITIQCYQYSDSNTLHYEYFDFINDQDDKIEQFYPNSDMSFIKFKNIVKTEWEAAQRQHQSMKCLSS
ncbi:cysteine dioxygenase [Vibrio quintilis]|uniref:Cysteine dioxygenase type I n=1 Tax=Vibrio quintilis TaxID=1117707 RepID=A0A1M7YP02_9VIBR|nr:cysteine dioxygenase family protein [Vibrio quintilis]SHO54341.1 Cysteine dioxygenase type I [Vibrio quintilis]